jgi:hypothetical protein
VDWDCDLVDTSFPHAQGPPLKGLRYREGRGIWCFVCGRPLGLEEDMGPWRVQVYQPSSRWDFRFRVICPVHYEG